MIWGNRILSRMLAVVMAVVVASSLSVGAAFADSSYMAGKPSDATVDVQAKKTGWKTTKAGKTYLKKGVKVVGLQKIKGKYYYFNSKGVMKTSDVKVAGATFYIGGDGKVYAAKYNGTYYYGTLKKMTSDDSYDFDTFMWARSIVNSITSGNDSNETKLHKAFDWVMNKYYAIHSPEFNAYEKTWPARFARYHFSNQGGDCHADAAAFAYLAAAIGYPADACIDAWGTGTMSSHAWTMIGNKVYDPLFAQSKSYAGYYGVTSGTYETNPTARFRVPMYKASNNKKGAVSQNLLDAGSMGLKKIKGKYYYYKNGKKVKNVWKTIDGKRYYFKKNGAAATLSTKVKGTYYVFSTKGVLQKSTKSGKRIVTFGKDSYQVSKAGKAVAGWSADKKRYAKANGLCLRSAWKTIDGKRYYFKSDGVRATGSVKVGNGYYVFGANGVLLKGSAGQATTLVMVGGNTYRVDSNGKAVAGWSSDNTQRFDAKGLLLRGVWYLGKSFYAADASGVYLPEATSALNAAAGENKPASELKSALDAAGAVGKTPVYTKSCDFDGDDGLWEYDHFIVTTARPKGATEYIRSIVAV